MIAELLKQGNCGLQDNIRLTEIDSEKLLYDYASVAFVGTGKEALTAPLS